MNRVFQTFFVIALLLPITVQSGQAQCKTAKGKDIIRCARSVHVHGDTIDVSLEIIRDNLYPSFARIVEFFPVHYDVRFVETSGSAAATNDLEIKFIFVELPEKKSIQVSYQLIAKKAPQNHTIRTMPLHGEFRYLYNGCRQTFDLPDTEVAWPQ